MTLKQIKLFNLLVMTFAVSFLIFIVFPKGREIYNLKKKIELTKLKIRNGKKAILHQSVLEKQVSIQTLLLNRVKGLFIQKNEQPKVYQLINKAAKKTSLTILSLKPQPQDKSEDLYLGTDITFQKMPLRIELEGTYQNLAYFFSLLTGTSKYFSIQELKLQKQDRKKHLIKAELIMNEYILIEYE